MGLVRVSVFSIVMGKLVGFVLAALFCYDSPVLHITLHITTGAATFSLLYFEISFMVMGVIFSLID